MNLRSLLTTGLAGATAVFLSVGPARAGPVFDFSFEVTGGDLSSGTVTGQIFGLSDNATSAATDVVITSIPAGAPAYVPSLPIDVMAGTYTVNSNSFTVSGGMITSGTFTIDFGTNQGNQFQLEPGTGTMGFPGALTLTDPTNPMNTWSIIDANTAPVSYSLAQVPEPSSIAVIGMALCGLALMRRRTFA